MAEHSDRYQYPVDYFTDQGFIVYAMDLRGHGRSDGRQSYAASLEVFLEDIRLFLQKVRKEMPHRRIFLIGHSFGGQLVLNYGAHFPDSLGGIIVSSPNIRLRLKIPLWKRLMAPVLSTLLPTLTVGNTLDPRSVSRNPEVVEAYRRDSKIRRKITLRLADVMLGNQLNILDVARRLHLPTFLMHAGDDQICSPEGTREFFEKVPASDKSLKIYDGFYHELFNEIERETVFKDMERWIRERI